MEIKANAYVHPSFSDFNEKYARIIEQGTAYAYQIQKMKSDDPIFRTQSSEKIGKSICFNENLLFMAL